MVTASRSAGSAVRNASFIAVSLLVTLSSGGLVGCAGVASGTNTKLPPTSSSLIVAVTSPGNSAEVDGTVSVTATATGQMPVAAVQFQLDGANVGPALTTA